MEKTVEEKAVSYRGRGKKWEDINAVFHKQMSLSGDEDGTVIMLQLDFMTIN